MPLKIAIVLDPWDYPFNGTVVSTRRFVAALTAQGHEFVIFATEARETAAGANPRVASFKRLSLPGLNHVMTLNKSPLGLPDRERMRELMADCDLLHVQYPFFIGGAAITIARDMGIPILSSFHVQPENILRNLGLRSELLARFVSWVWMRFHYRHSDMVIAPSPFASGLLRECGYQGPVQVISNGVPEDMLYLPQRIAEAGEVERYRILSVGRLSGEKRQDLIMDALAHSEYADQVQLTLVGTGPREAKLRRQAERMPYPVEFLQPSDDELVALYRNADLFVHAGESELEGMSVLEAMAHSLPIIVADSAVSAARDLASDPHSLFAFPDARDLRRRIDYFLANPGERLASAQQNYQHARRMTHQRSAEQLLAIYEQITGKGEAQPATREGLSVVD
jgi:glycosyltransferase involved in cell wall biosynthesis